MGFIKNILYAVSNKKMLRFFRNQTVFPSYHLVNDNLVNHIKHLYEYKNIEQFSADIDTLVNNYSNLELKNFKSIFIKF